MGPQTVIMDPAEWRARQHEHAERVRPWVQPRQTRRRTGGKHPTDDFLFEYYPYSVNKITTWHPGHGVVLAGDADSFLANPAYVRTDDGVTTGSTGLRPRRDRLKLAVRILSGTLEREPVLGCFALHEWAMVYGLEQGEIRHSAFPLRIEPERIRATVDDVGLRCTHIDAYRFFTDEAVPLNALIPTRETQPDLEQPGCLHATMDLYKYAMWFSPWIGSDLIADCFELARQARELDMRASPYDMSEFDLAAIPVETNDGRREYGIEQRRLMHASAPLRQRLRTELEELPESQADPAP